MTAQNPHPPHPQGTVVYPSGSGSRKKVVVEVAPQAEKVIWEITWEFHDDIPAVQDKLTDGWEPFVVTQGDNTLRCKIWMRRQRSRR